MPPPERLYVYEVLGRVSPPTWLTGEDFLGCWREGDCSYLFFSQPRSREVQAWLAANPGLGQYLSETDLNYADWEAGQPFRPLSLAGFHLSPIWEEPAPRPGELVLRLEPGLAFGSGYHPTTRLCLALVREVFDQAPPAQVLDLGTGTGILALACLALGARRVVAVEYNDLAVRTAARNLRHNRREREVLLIQGDARHFAYLPADLVLANIHLDVLLDLVALPRFLDKQWYIFSGILGAQMERFQARLQDSPLSILSVRDENLWFAVLARNVRHQA
ncbi:MAG: methyltransferase domain-containing protein [Deltaproteobacteria bacterium]|nr:methyltransferase domain-containing protein [Deltaproteobacteria bacterium]